jgi:hypothetical protein
MKCNRYQLAEMTGLCDMDLVPFGGPVKLIDLEVNIRMSSESNPAGGTARIFPPNLQAFDANCSASHRGRHCVRAGSSGWASTPP